MKEIITTIQREIDSLNLRIKALTEAQTSLLKGMSEEQVQTAYKPTRKTAAPQKKKRVRPIRRTRGASRSAILEALKSGASLTCPEIAKVMATNGFPFRYKFLQARASLVRSTIDRMAKEGTLTKERTLERGITFSLKRHAAAAPKDSRTSAQKKPQWGLSQKIIKILADEGVTGAGLTAHEVMTKMLENGFNFTAKNPSSSVTGLITDLTRRNVIKKLQKPGETNRYKIVATSELIEKMSNV